MCCEKRFIIYFDQGREGAAFHQIDAKAAQLSSRPHLNKVKNDIKNPELIKLTERKEEYRKNDKYLVYRVNDRREFNSIDAAFRWLDRQLYGQHFLISFLF